MFKVFTIRTIQRSILSCRFWNVLKNSSQGIFSTIFILASLKLFRSGWWLKRHFIMSVVNENKNVVNENILYTFYIRKQFNKSNVF